MRLSAKAVNRRKGSTLVEMVVTIALLAILATMTVVFSSLVGKYVGQNHKSYAFYEECSELKEAVSDLLSAQDEQGKTWSVSTSEIKRDGGSFSLSFAGGKLTVKKSGSETEKEFKSIDHIAFALPETGAGGSNQVIKCTVYGQATEEDGLSQSFLLSVRCATFTKEAGGE